MEKVNRKGGWSLIIVSTLLTLISQTQCRFRPQFHPQPPGKRDFEYFGTFPAFDLTYGPPENSIYRGDVGLARPAIRNFKDRIRPDLTPAGIKNLDPESLNLIHRYTGGIDQFGPGPFPEFVFPNFPPPNEYHEIGPVPYDLGLFPQKPNYRK